jgi:hypothetical protein
VLLILASSIAGILVYRLVDVPLDDNYHGMQHCIPNNILKKLSSS